ncbi:MGMT family protein [Chiua virens]|nr:MGMT family protein [Chiua virens]
MPRHSRHVGQGSPSIAFTFSIVNQTLTVHYCCTALKFLSPEVTPPVPWHRVISSSGTISSRGPGTTGAQRQRDALEAEGVEVTDGRTGDFRVNLATWAWFPAPGTVDVGDHDPPGAGTATELDIGVSNH